MATGDEHGEVDDLNSFTVTLATHDGLSLLITSPRTE
jgi:hypothetical protein